MEQIATSSYFPQWAIDLATLFSILGFVITCWLLYEAKQIRNSFLKKARLPQIIKDLEDVSAKINVHLSQINTEKRDVIKQLSISKALIENIIPKLPSNAKVKCKAYIKSSRHKKLSSLTDDQLWEQYTDLSVITALLVQVQHDSTWD